MLRKKRGCKKRTGIIDDINDKSDIAQLFARNFLANQSTYNDDTEISFINDLKSVWSERRKFNARISSESLRKIITNLNDGVGHDGVHSIFLKSASSDFLENLASFFNACFIHCYLPCDLLKGTISPIPKDKKNCTDSGNYRPVMQSSCLLKIFEIHFLDILVEKLSLNFRQFGFIKGSSTTDACFFY